jgi:hypothetical protein
VAVVEWADATGSPPLAAITAPRFGKPAPSRVSSGVALTIVSSNSATGSDMATIAPPMP